MGKDIKEMRNKSLKWGLLQTGGLNQHIFVLRAVRSQCLQDSEDLFQGFIMHTPQHFLFSWCLQLYNI